MPAPGQTNPDALPARISTWLADNPGGHRARDIGVGLGVPPDTTQEVWSRNVGRALARMVKQRTVIRTQVTPEGWKQPVGLYAAPVPVEA